MARRSFLRASITNLDSSKEFLEKTFSNSDTFIPFYKFISSAKGNPKELENRFSDWEKISYFFTQKIYETDEKQFGKNYIELIQSEKKRLKDFYPLESDNNPEYWIKKTFKELHKIFETFEGSMLISMVFGLVEENNGLVYYMNAEHPLVVLYRDKKASFIQERKLFNKLGQLGVESEIFVSTFQMLPGDKIIIGSDGKDDFIVTKNEMSREINDDENIF